MLRPFSILLLLLVQSGPATAQPFSQSMAQCAGLYEAMATLLSKPGDRAKLDAAAAAFSSAALTEAESEGQDDPAAWVAQHRDGKRADWEARGTLAALSQDFRDWAGYCRSFAAERGIEIRLD